MQADELNIWKGRIQRSEGLQNGVKKEWQDAIDLVNCDYFDKNTSELDERVDVHFANWYYNNLVPLTYYRDPFIYIKTKTDDMSRFAETMEKAINIKWKDLELKDQFKDVIGSALIMPPGWMKSGYTAKIGQDVARHEENKEKGVIKTLKESFKSLLNGSNPKESAQKLPEQQGVLDIHIKEESVFASWVSSWNILMPVGYNRISDMPWLCEWEDVPVVDFKANPMYKNKEDIKGIREINSAADGSTGDAISKVPYSGATFTDKDDNQVVRLYHIWDRRGRRRFTFSMRCQDAHFDGEWPYDITGFPYRPLIFDKRLPQIDKANPYPINCLKPILPQIIEQSQARTQMAKWRRRASAIIIAQKGMLTQDDMNQLEDSEALQICYVSNKDAILMTQTPPLPNGIFDVEAQIKEDLQMATNMGQIMFAPPKGTRTATQAKIGQGGLDLKISAKQDAVEDFTALIARDLCQLMWQFMDRNQVKELIGEDVSEDMWPDLPDDLNERRRVIQNMQIRIDAGSAAPPKDDTVDKKQTLDMISILKSVAPNRLNEGEVAKQVMKKFKFSKELDKMVFTNDEEEEKAAEEENGFLVSNHPQIVSPNTNHQIHLKVHAQIAGKSAAGDQHILDHAKALGIAPQGGGKAAGGPQKGDSRPPMNSTNPEQVRKGNMTQANIMSSAQNLGAGSRGVPVG